ncbi:hypothetical protein [Geodermatophilus sp. DSM 45219]|uniref:hypothetical protein n=1 Tax=Geodermatophilus sp. DSM 45219 TaxID=1881103 RepID=UPI000880D1E0|nr:hypothetical protein [Geodermatophilus sp. DSM 45219]SDO22472.1 hypothetical protein SAMN05428965_3280 [Geodermatophilus sp. DSM 45219]
MTEPRPVGGRQEFRPSLGTCRRALRSPGRLIGPLLALAALVVSAAGGGPGLVLALLAAVLLVALQRAAWLAVGRVRVSDSAVQRRGLTGRTRSVPRGDIASALLMPGFHERGDPPTGLLLLLDDRRRPLLRLSGEPWGLDWLREIAHASAVPVTVLDDDLTPGELAWRRVYEMPWWDRHRTLLEVAVVLTVVAVLVGIALLAG